MTPTSERELGLPFSIPRPTARPAWGAQLILAGLCVLSATVLWRVGPWPALAVLGLLAVFGCLLQSAVAPGVTRRLALGPLTLFVLALTVVLGLRATALAAGQPGRFFAIDSRGHVVSSTLVPPSVRASGDYDTLRNPSVEADLRDWGAPESNAQTGFHGTLKRIQGGAFDGNWSAVAGFSSGRGSSYIDVPIGISEDDAKAHVHGGSIVSGSLAVRTLTTLPRNALVALHVTYYTSNDRYILDRTLSGKDSLGAVVGPRNRRWFLLRGTDVTPRGAAYANLLLLVRRYADQTSYRIALDAAYLSGAAHSRSDFRFYSPAQTRLSIWRDAYMKALAIVVALLAAVLLGFTFSAGARLAGRLPELTLMRSETRKARLAIVGAAIVGLLAYFVEIRSYGGYRAYLRDFGTSSTDGAGKWYVHAVALVPSGLAVGLVTQRISASRTTRWRLWEIAVILGGFAIAASYAQKATLAIPVLTLLLTYYVYSRRATRWLAAFGVAFAILTPFVYQIRGRGTGSWTTLLSSGYWRDFLTNLQSRFYHFESLMVLIPFRSTVSPLQPVVDVFANVVPRYFWPSKPISTDAQFTHAYLQGGLHSATDIGVISLPGELWQLGGWWAIFIVGVALGILIRAASALMTAPRSGAGSVLLAITATTFFIFLNDGWGFASALTTVLISAVAWLAFLRPVRSPAE
jgi:hypothetical protein